MGFGLLALVVALVGVLATMTTLVAERRRGLAIRVALGASPSRLAWWLVGRGLALTAAGIALGLSLGSAAARSLASLVQRVSPYDAATFAGTAAAVISGPALMTYALRCGLARSIRLLSSSRSELGWLLRALLMGDLSIED